MGCLLALTTGVIPRFLVAVIWLLRPAAWDAAFGGPLVPILGVIFLPFTTLIYAIAWAPGVHLGNGRWVWVAIALVIELIGYAGTARSNRERMVRA